MGTGREGINGLASLLLPPRIWLCPTRSQEAREPGIVAWWGSAPCDAKQGRAGKWSRNKSEHYMAGLQPGSWQSWNSGNVIQSLWPVNSSPKASLLYPKATDPVQGLTASHLDNRNGFITCFPVSTLNHSKMPSMWYRSTDLICKQSWCPSLHPQLKSSSQKAASEPLTVWVQHTFPPRLPTNTLRFTYKRRTFETSQTWHVLSSHIPCLH